MVQCEGIVSLAMPCLFRTFSLLIMGDTERPRYTSFRGLSVRGITALQCSALEVTRTAELKGEFNPAETHYIDLYKL